MSPAEEDLWIRIEALEARVEALEALSRRDHRPREVHPNDQALADKLRDWRRDRAAVEGCKPFQVFGNRVLTDIATTKPGDRYELEQIKGFGPKAMAEYANDVLGIIHDHAGW